MKVWLQAFRLRTLPLAVSGWLVGIAIILPYREIDWLVAGLTLFTAFLLQVLSNLANDFGDASSGVDHEREGELRMVSAGLISPAAMKRAVIICALMTLASGLALLYLSFAENIFLVLIFLFIGLSGIVAAIKYTIGSSPYGYAGFGDLFVLIFFGLVLVYGTFFLQVKTLYLRPLLPAFSVGLFAVAVLNVNNIRDMASDRRSGKNSIPVRIGKKGAVAYHKLLLIGGLVAATVFCALNGARWYEYSFYLMAVPFYINLRAVSTKTGHDLDPYLKQMALSALGFAILFTAGQLLSSIF